MKPIDKFTLGLQFWNRVYRKNATEYHSYFEDIMQKAFPDFKIIIPYGRKGDAGNDGYRPSKGIYYQVYAPKDPREKEAAAAKKVKEDFDKVKTHWDEISKIKTYYFVFNDKGAGTTIILEKALCELRNDNPGIKFELFLPRALERVFFTLKPEDLLALDFVIDKNKSIGIGNEYLNKLERDLDRGTPKFVMKALDNIRDILLALEDEDLQLNYEILEARTYLKLERADDAIEKFENLCKRYPNDPRAFLHLAEFYLTMENFVKNEQYLEEAEEIDSEFWLLRLEKLIRVYRLGNKIAVSKIDESTFPDDSRIRSNFYRIYGFFLAAAEEQKRAMSFIERAIYLNPDRFGNYDAKLAILERRVFSQNPEEEDFLENVSSFLREIEAVQNKVNAWGEMIPRTQAILNLRKFNVYSAEQNIGEIENLTKPTFELIMLCYFDYLIDKLLVLLLMHIVLPQQEFDRLFQYLERAEKAISNELAKAIVLQLAMRKALITEGKRFFESIREKRILDFIDNIENKKYDLAIAFLGEDQPFATAMAYSAKEFPDFRKKIIENLPSDIEIQKEILLFQLYYDEEKIEEAFALLKSLDISKVSYFACKAILEIAERKKAWDSVIILAQMLLPRERDERVVLQLLLQIFNANNHLNNYAEVIRIGEATLSEGDAIDLLDDQNKESLLGQTIQARLKRTEYKEAKMLLEKYATFSKSFDFKIAIEAEVYLKDKEAEKALSSVVAGVKMLKTPRPEEYGALFGIFTEIGNMIDFPLTPFVKVSAECFVKLKARDRWYFVGDGDELDATKISSMDPKYPLFIDKKIGEYIVFENKYSSRSVKNSIESILPIEKYIIWQCFHHAQELTREKRWDKMEHIEVPITGETADPKYIIARLEEEHKKRGDFFKLYCEKNLPLAFLAINEGGLTNAIGLIANENKGFIRFSSGRLSEIKQQKDIASKIIAGDAFYIDGTSAWVLSETGLLGEIYNYLPNLRVPQSVIPMLFQIKEKFIFRPGHGGYMRYIKGHLEILPVDQNTSESLQRNFENSIKILEANSQRIAAISSANKANCFSEQKVAPELCDACILAQKENMHVLTEDFLYLQANELETKKKRPEYCSSFALIRTLYEQKKVNFEQYLNYFRHLSSYRFRFLPISIVDIEKAVFGDGAIKVVKPERIRHLNFPLTLSLDYGVPFDKAFVLVGQLLVKVLNDNAIPAEIVVRIFTEILSTFPTHRDKTSLGNLLLTSITQIIEKNRGKIMEGTQVQEKLKRLSEVTTIYSGKGILLG